MCEVPLFSNLVANGCLRLQKRTNVKFLLMYAIRPDFLQEKVPNVTIDEDALFDKVTGLKEVLKGGGIT